MGLAVALPFGWGSTVVRCVATWECVNEREKQGRGTRWVQHSRRMVAFGGS
jgi:hypothetical protein